MPHGSANLSPEVLRRALSQQHPADSVAIVNEAGTILYANEQLCRLSGFASDKLHGEIIERLLPERFRLGHIQQRIDFTDHHRQRLMEHASALPLRCEDGQEHPVRISLHPVRSGLETLVIAVIRPAEA